jgi:5-methylcytosine-specific restriction endonuclease McrA
MREYLLEKFNRTCVYCGVRDVPMEVEHIVPKTRDGSNRVSNLTLSCQPCNQKKNDQTAAEFGYPEVEKQAKAPLKDAAAVNATRLAMLSVYRVEVTRGHPHFFSAGKRSNQG